MNDTITTPETPTANVTPAQFAWLNEKVTKLNKRATRLGVQKMVIKVTGTSTRYTYAFHGQAVKSDKPINDAQYKLVSQKPIRTIEIIGDEIKLPGWKLVARIQHVTGAEGETGSVLHEVPGEDLPVEFRDRKICDHCQTKRMRKDTFVLRSEDSGEYKQVGRQCIKDFLGHINPTALALRAEYAGLISVITGDEDEDEWGGDKKYATDSHPCEWTFYNALLWANILIEKEGFARANEESPTKHALNTLLIYRVDGGSTHFGRGEDPNKKWAQSFEETATDRQKTKSMIEWIKNLPGHSTYEANLQNLNRINFADSKALGLIASVPSSYERAMGREIKRKERQATFAEQAAKSNHVGELKQRIRNMELTCDFRTSFDTQFGTTFLLKFADADGNVYAWFASNSAHGVQVGDKVTLTGTVKKHDDYKGMKQTVLTRCKVHSNATEEEREAEDKKYQEAEAAKRKAAQEARQGKHDAWTKIQEGQRAMSVITSWFAELSDEEKEAKRVMVKKAIINVYIEHPGLKEYVEARTAYGSLVDHQATNAEWFKTWYAARREAVV